MRWTPSGVSGDIEDRRDSSGGGGFGFGGGGVPFGIGGLLVLLVLSFIFKRDLISPFLNSGSPGGAATISRPEDPARKAAESREVQFVSFVLDDAQADWDKLIPNYRHAKLVLFRDQTNSPCGQAGTATGPFYCPGDEKVYLDLGFFDELRSRFGASGEFAQAYVIAHEIGHHVQKILGIERTVRAEQQRNPGAANQLSVLLELQADCLAGVWGNSTEQRNLIDQSDVTSALNAAAAVGDDRLQKQATGRVMPDKFTHGTSAQRAQWFKTGLTSGSIKSCNTFSSGP
ncbi:MAG TPA: neutral zinc metallopeptidase [Candidatus Acidoferrales bacterium]|nr:neutral zinc metallopeptidase [Candidatus Acidoferrales bacterium]